ncbi:MAG: 3-dehydroquinate synthase [Paludibacteraceae bacterium]|nr:3-dehydroquinate synthase [Paludibacteraceae bacterium]
MKTTLNFDLVGWLEHVLTQALGMNSDKHLLLLADEYFLPSLSAWQRPLLAIKATEDNKSLATLDRIYTFLHEHNATRHSWLICLGGGMITDIGGFAAATFKRGMRVAYVPTTLLAMVDASIGGKTSINGNGVKNEIGVIRQPHYCFTNHAFVVSQTLKDRLSGFAEMLKHALVADKQEWVKLLLFLENDGLKKVDGSLSELIEHSRQIKEQVVSTDIDDTDRRQILNFGHTIGHAIEALSYQKHQPLPHGYAVMQGIVAELYLSCINQHLPQQVLSHAARVMKEYYGKPDCQCSDYDTLIRLMYADKKNQTAHNIQFTLLQDIGQPIVKQTVTEKEIKEALDYLFTI